MVRGAYLEGAAVLGLLLVYYAEAEVYLMRLVKVGLHLHDLGKGLLGVIEGAIAVVQDADAIPEPGFLRVPKIDKGGLVRIVGLLQVVHHQVAVTCRGAVSKRPQAVP